VRKLEYLLEQAIAADEQGQLETAEKKYSFAVETALEDLKTMSDQKMMAILKDRVKLALDRLEDLKRLKNKPKEVSPDLDLPAPPTFDPSTKANRSQHDGTGDLEDQLRHLLRRGPLTSFQDATSELNSIPAAGSRQQPTPKPAQSSSGKKPGGGGGGFSQKEKKILEYTGFINGKMYVPWVDSDVDELKTVTKIPGTFKDPDGLPPLSEKQKSRRCGWARPDDICEDPKMIKIISSMAIKQTLIGDCSFVASLAISADYERKFREPLITSIIYPQNRHGQPVISPSGKYMIKLHLNGCRRKVVIDDRLPLGDDGELLCSFSENEDEFWVSLVEKAYMKVMGGYDFPGSSSNIDLHALTGWIPERVDLKNNSNLESVFPQMEHTLKRGNALMTVATGELSEKDKDRSGLVPLHAYAILDVRSVTVGDVNHQLLQLKNPWHHQRWKGNFSEQDDNWTPELKKALHFDQMQALRDDNGVFWIDWKSLCQFFDVVYINWKPKLFPYKSTFHDVWDPSKEEYKDQYLYNISRNPQYRLIVKSEKAGRVWVLLTRHITQKEDFAHNHTFICVHVASGRGNFKTHFSGGYLIQGVKINTPHYLSQIEVPAGVTHYNLIVSQLMEKVSLMYYTLKVYSTVPFHLEPTKEPYSHRKKITDKWAGLTAGGCRNHPTFRNNPTYRLVLSPMAAAKCKLQVQLETGINEGVGLVIVAESPSTDGEGFKEHSTHTFRSHYIVEELDVVGGAYYVTPTTYNPGREGVYTLTVSTTCVFSFDRMHC
jgi:calpain-7